MRPFTLEQPTSPADASQLHAEQFPRARYIAGGTDLLAQVKEGTLRAQTLVSLANLPEMSGIESNDDGLDIGALVTLTELAESAAVRQVCDVLAKAALSVASPQIRNVGTIGGNLCQRPRCWYFRSHLYYCRKKGGETCYAFGEQNKYHAILAGGPCHIVHPSDLAVVLISLGAGVVVRNESDSREMPLEDMFVLPSVDVMAETVLRPGEWVSRIKVPKPAGGAKSVYLKAQERQALDFPLASVAASIQVRDAVVAGARVTLGSVAPVPFRVSHVDEALIGQRVGDIDPDAIGSLAVRDAVPLSDNGYKVRLTASLVSRAISDLLSDDR
ncbi:MAG: xanthine dehydrogenase family protein subunit M [SAR202 cluster bacterium]|jgi:xanthine dehydrogenase YagS FAD-binding subunit|nr:xanthine dehydrogenase family protein subunit M [SAR202 cluster bacterium]MDP7415108.1 xanthine dehydrogenase family protein subunit M [SAR202 cluster bacterium]|tara:strand:- start:9640 stop:10626 length:987 start_codon:yes stop_codon:yes gene_type:complete